MTNDVSDIPLQKGELADWYNSCPSYFDSGSTEEPAGPAVEVPNCYVRYSSRQPQGVEIILRKRPGKSGYVFRDRATTETCVRPLTAEFSVGTAFESFDRGEYPRRVVNSADAQAADLRRSRQTAAA